MKNLSIAFGVEFMKIRKSKILLATVIVFLFIPLMMVLMMFVSRNPEIAGKLGMIGTKAKIFGENDWPGYLALINQMMASIGLIGFGFVTTWVFGREHIDKTMKDLLALPVSRSSIVLAKFGIVFCWCMLLATVLFALSISAGLLMQLPGGSQEMLWNFSGNFLIASLLILFLCSPVSYLAGKSRGIIAPLGFVILTMIMAQFVGLIGLGPYFPWAIPGLYSVGADTAGLQLHVASYVILILTGALGTWGTLNWWNHADHH